MQLPNHDPWARTEPVQKGFSAEEKYHVWDEDGREYLLRIAAGEKYPAKRQIFTLLGQLEKQQVPASRPIDMGFLPDGRMYQLLSWLPGVDAEDYIRGLDSERAYALGLEAGQILWRLQQVPVRQPETPWHDTFQRHIDLRLQEYAENTVNMPKTAEIRDFLQENRHLVPHRPSVLMHGDFHVGNMVVDGDGHLGIIDFEKTKLADPYRDFKTFQWNVRASPHFASGMVDGYFPEKIPADFFPLLALQSAAGSLHMVLWAIPFGPEEVAVMKEMYLRRLQWFDDYRRTVPTWYVGKKL